MRPELKTHLIKSVVCLSACLHAWAQTPSITLPVEVMSPTECIKTVTVAATTGTAPYLLWMQIHGLELENEAEVQVNGGAWIPLNNQTASFGGYSKSAGGIGGAASVLSLVVSLPVGSIQAGTNTIGFRHLMTGFDAGYRVLALNFIDAGGRSLISSSAFVQDNPVLWQPPLSSAADSAQGQALFQRATLMAPLPASPVVQPIQAHCGDCHASDGRDLAYFNYSNQSIIARSQLHGLTALQGQQIASYIRNLNVPRPGRPWSSPYQPGAGVDEIPVQQWAAGAGLNAVAGQDQQTLQAVAAQNDNINIRETPITLQLPDWNHWLPKVHPLDAYGVTFSQSKFNADYATLVNGLKPGDPVAYFNQRFNIQQWDTDFYNELNPQIQPAVWTPASAEQVYSVALWKLVKIWELMQANQLEGMAQAIFGPQAQARAWYSGWPFQLSPNMLHIPKGGMLRGFSDTAYDFTSMQWYQLQLTLNGGNGKQEGPSPVDWPYSSGHIKDINWDSKSPQAGLELLLLSYGLGMANRQLHGPEGGSQGWIPWMSDPSRLIHPAWEGNWSATTPPLRASVTEAHLRRWWAVVQNTSPAQWIQGGWVTPNEQLTPNTSDGSFGNQTMYMIPRLKYVGVNPGLVNQIADWASTIWPGVNWNAVKLSSCGPSIVYCSGGF